MNTTSIEAELSRVIGAISILTPHHIRFGNDEPIQVPLQFMARQDKHPVPHDNLVYLLQSLMYTRCYCHRLEDPPPLPLPENLELPRTLSQANHSNEHWDYGWQVGQLGPHGQMLIVKGERQRLTSPGEYLNSIPGTPPQVGSFVSIRMPRDSFVAQPGFYWMYGDIPTDIWDEYGLIRFYFNCNPESIVHVVDYMSGTLNRYQVPYRMKALTSAQHYTRTDCAVLYCSRRYFSIVSRTVSYLPPSTSQMFDVSVPLFSKRIRDGVGFAEDPGTGESFGMHRCRLVSEGLVDAWRQGQYELSAKLAAIRKRFTSNGLILEKPYLNAGSFDIFPALEETQAA